MNDQTAAVPTSSRPLGVALLGKQPEDGLAFDQGGGRIVTVTRDGWRYDEPLNGQELLELPCGDHPQGPAEGGSLRELRELLNVSAENWEQLVTWAVAALIPNIAQPVLLLTGEQGSGKSVTARMLASLLDHGALPIGPLPTDNDEWDAMADRSRVIAIDEVAHVSDWLADAMCRAVTGDVLVERELYTEMAAEEPFERRHRCVIASGSIAPDELPADLLDRTVVVQLQQVEGPRPVSDMWKAFDEARPRILGALLDTLVAALNALPMVRERADRGELLLPRLADYTLVAAAVAEPSGPSTGGR